MRTFQSEQARAIFEKFRKGSLVSTCSKSPFSLPSLCSAHRPILLTVLSCSCFSSRHLSTGSPYFHPVIHGHPSVLSIILHVSSTPSFHLLLPCHSPSRPIDTVLRAVSSMPFPLPSFTPHPRRHLRCPIHTILRTVLYTISSTAFSMPVHTAYICGLSGGPDPVSL